MVALYLETFGIGLYSVVGCIQKILTIVTKEKPLACSGKTAVECHELTLLCQISANQFLLRGQKFYTVK